MPLTSFCGLLTLQVGAAVLAGVFFTLAGAISAANMFSYDKEDHDGFPCSFVLMIVLVIGLIIASLLMFASSYAESRGLAITALFVIFIILCYWIILSVFSFVNDPKHLKNVCMKQRCPESFWIADLKYRNDLDSDPHKENYVIDSRLKKETGEENVNLQRIYVKNEIYSVNEHTISHTDFLRDESYDEGIEYQTNDVGDNNRKKQTGNRYENTYGLPFIGSVILFVLNLLFLLFSGFIMWSWASELDWADYYIEDEPVIVYEDPYVESF